LFPAEINKDLAKITYEDNKSIYFDIGAFTYAVVKQNNLFYFFIKYNSSQKTPQKELTEDSILELDDNTPTVTVTKPGSNKNANTKPVKVIQYRSTLNAIDSSTLFTKYGVIIIGVLVLLFIVIAIPVFSKLIS
jgi:hypothetical protein